MRLEAGDAASLWAMLAACDRVARFIRGRSLPEFEADDFFRSAVERQIEIIGEAARGLTDAYKAAHPEVPWRPIIAQ